MKWIIKTTDGTTVATFDRAEKSEDEIRADVADRNKRAEELGIAARYEVEA
jgi:hypothetical protein